MTTKQDQLKSAQPWAADGQGYPSPASQDVHGVLVVEDEDTIRIMVQHGLERHGFKVWSTVDGREALEIYRFNLDAIHVLLLDVQIPGLDGPQTLDLLRKLNPKVPACFMSAGLGDYEPSDLLERGGSCLIAKPFQLDRLAAVLKSLANGALQEPGVVDQ